MKSYYLTLTIIMTILLTSCAFQGHGKNAASGAVIGIPKSEGQIAPVSMTSYTRSDYTIHIRKEGYLPERLEPDNGCYLGSYVLANANIGYDMNEFDALTGKRHALSVYNMKLGDKFPFEWVLECIAEMKTPYIIVRPSNEYSVFQEESLETAAREFGEISVPIFMDFYPNPQSYTRDYEAYANFYRKASETFSELAPNVVFVLSADSKNVYDFCLYYPGDEYTDWIGIIIYQPLYTSGEVNLRNYMKDLDYLYQTYQRKKPLIVSQLAVSSYSTKDHRYAVQEASKRLTDFYSALQNEYTRIKGVVYMDFNNVTGAPKNAERDNFSVTQDKSMLKAYSEAISDEWFLSAVSGETGEKSELFKSPFAALEDENFKYVPQGALTAEGVDIGGVEIIDINGEIFYSTEKLSKSSKINCFVDDDNKRIIISGVK